METNLLVYCAGGRGYGAGSGGSVGIHYWGETPPPTSGISVAAGAGTVPGTNGLVLVNHAPRLFWTGGGPWGHGQVSFSWQALALDPQATWVTISAFGQDASHPVFAGLLTNRIGWDTTSVPNGRYQFKVVFRTEAGTGLGELAGWVLVNNAVEWHAGTLAGNQTWASNTVHVVSANLTVGSGATLIIEPGAVVKVAQGVRILVANGATLQSLGTAEARITFTALTDDALGGDTNWDAASSAPQPGEWLGIGTEGGGQWVQNEHAAVRYAPIVHAGALAVDATWSGTWLHRVTDHIIVPAGVTLTVQPGAIVKFDLGKGLTVRTGGRLVAEGTLPEPIVLTSIRDDAAGGDSNGDGDQTGPAAGDWGWLFAEGGEVRLHHCRVRYGAGPVEGGWGPPGDVSRAKGMIKTSGQATLSLSNCYLTDAFYDGVLAWGGFVTVANSILAGHDRAVCAHPGAVVRVVHCTLDDNRIGLLAHGGELAAVNSIVAGSLESGVQYDFGPAAALRYCNVWSTNAGAVHYRNTAGLTGQAGNVSVPPTFRAPGQGDYRLDYGSACIDAAEGESALATDLMGAGRYNDPRTPNTGTALADGMYADLGAFEFVETADSEIDLVATDLEGPAVVVAGQPARVSWKVVNLGSGVMVGPWHDRLSLATAEGVRLQVAEVLVGQGVTLGPGQTHRVEAEVAVPGGPRANYWWQVTVNTRADIFEGRMTTNNHQVSLASVSLEVPTLEVGGPAVTGRFGALGDDGWYGFSVRAGQAVAVHLELADESNEAQLYLGEGYVPGPDVFDARPREARPGNLTAVIHATTDGWCYVTTQARRLPQGNPAFSIRAVELDFGVTGVQPGAVGNAGAVTLKVSGAKLRAGTQFRVVGVDGTPRLAQRVSVVNEETSYATFDLTELAPGPAGIEADQDGAVVTRGGLLEVLAGGQGEFYAGITGPTVLRAGRPGSWSLTYGNRGLVDVELPLLQVSLPGALNIRLFDHTLNWADQFVLLALNEITLLPTLGPGQEVTLTVEAIPGVAAQAEMSLRLMPAAAVKTNLAVLPWDQLARPIGVDPALWQAQVQEWASDWGLSVADLYALLLRELDEIRADGLRFEYVANVNGRWLFGPEPCWPLSERPLIELDEDFPVPAEAAAAGAAKALDRRPADGIRRTYFVVIAVSDYRGVKARDLGAPVLNWNPNLPGVEKDYQDLRQYFNIEHKIPRSQAVILRDTIARTNDTVTRQAILEGIRGLKGKVDADDNVVIYYAGHGVTRKAPPTLRAALEPPQDPNPRLQVFYGERKIGELVPPATNQPPALAPAPARPKPAGRKGYWLLGNAEVVSASDLQGAIDELGAGTTYLVNDSCTAEAMAVDIHPTNSAFVGFSATHWNRPAKETPQGGLFTSEFKSHLRACNSLQKSFDRTASFLRAVTAGEEVGRGIKGLRKEGVAVQAPLGPPLQEPVLTNPDGISLEGKPWTEALGATSVVRQALQQLYAPGRSNVVTLVQRGTQIVGSWDPNDKIGPGGVGALGFVNGTQPLPYVIHFENQAAAQAPAQEVRITDQLESGFDWSSFTFDAVAFNGVVLRIPAGLQAFSAVANVASDLNPVEIIATFDPATGLAGWTLASRDPFTGLLPEDPFAGFLPPNDASRRGEGYVSFSIRPRTNLVDGATLRNQATIAFDPTYGVNPPMATPPVTNCLDVAPPFSAVEPLPARSRPALTVRWAGTDAGSGVASYDLYVAQDGGPYRLWLPATPATAAQFAGRAGSTYAFASVAVDGVGNREPFPAQPDAVTTLVAVTPPLITSARVEGAFFRLRVDGLEPGQTYVVERLLDLSAPDWVWANEFTPEGTVADHGLPLEPQWSQAFFRLRLR